jgi:hypothetical protein
LPGFDRAVAFDDPVTIEPGALELAVHVRCEDERPERWPSRQPQESKKPGVRAGRSIEVQAVSVEAPGQVWIVVEPTRIGQVDERQTELAIGRVGVLKSVIAAKVGQPRVDPHPRPGGDEEQVRRGDGPCSRSDILGTRQAPTIGATDVAGSPLPTSTRPASSGNLDPPMPPTNSPRMGPSCG